MTLKFTEPLDAALPSDNWRLYPFKGDQAYGNLNYSLLYIIFICLDKISLFKKKSCYLFGRDH